MSRRIKHEIGNILLGSVIGADFSITIVSLWHGQYVDATVFGILFALLYVVIIKLETLALWEDLMLREADSRRQFAELMLKRLEDGDLDVSVHQGIIEELSNESKD